MSTRFDVCSPRPRKDSEKPFWHRVGTAWKNDKGISITFDSLPLPDKEGRVSVVLFEPRDKAADTAPKRQTGGVSDYAAEKADMDDEIPF